MRSQPRARRRTPTPRPPRLVPPVIHSIQRQNERIRVTQVLVKILNKQSQAKIVIEAKDMASDVTGQGTE